MSSPSNSSSAQDRLSPDDALPPVEPPSAGFILQLFIVPGAIVLIIVMVWLMFHWLAQQGNDPEAYVAALERNNEARWQAAVNLANVLGNDQAKGYDALKHDANLSRRLAQILSSEMDAGSMEERPVTLRIFLCRTLGEVSVPEGMPALLKTASVNRDEKELPVRRAAVEAVALLWDSLRREGKLKNVDQAQVDSTLLATSEDEDQLLRSTAAYTLGVIGDEAAIERLNSMLTDSYPDARYNAALGLARNGDPRCAATIVEMLDLDDAKGVEIEQESDLREFKRGMLVVNALRAVDQLLAKNPQAELPGVRAAVDKLLDAKIDTNIRAQARATKKLLDERPSPQPGKI